MNRNGIQINRVDGRIHRLVWPTKVNLWDTHFEQIISMWEDGEAKSSDVEKMLDKIIRRCPEFVDVYNSLGAIAWRQGQIPQAMRHFERGWQLCSHLLTDTDDMLLPWSQPENRPLLRLMHNVALGFLSQGKRDEAIRILENELRLNPEDNQNAAQLLFDINSHRIAFTVGQRLCQMFGIDEVQETRFVEIVKKADDHYFNEDDDTPLPFHVESERMEFPFYAGLIFHYASKVEGFKEEWLDLLAHHAAGLCNPMEGGGIPAYIFSIYARLIESKTITPNDIGRLRDLIYIRPPGDEWISNPSDTLTIANLIADTDRIPLEERRRLLLLLLSYQEISKSLMASLMLILISKLYPSRDEARAMLQEILTSPQPGPLKDDEFWENFDVYQDYIYEYDEWELNQNDHSFLTGLLADMDDPESLFLADEGSHWIASDKILFDAVNDPYAPSSYWPLTVGEDPYELPEDDWAGYRRIRLPSLPPSARRLAIHAMSILIGSKETVTHYYRPHSSMEQRHGEIRHGVLDILEKGQGIDPTTTLTILDAMAADRDESVATRSQFILRQWSKPWPAREKE